MTLNDKTRIMVAPDVLVQPLEGESILLSMQSGTYFGLNRVGTRMWQAVTTAPSLADAVQALATTYDAPTATLRADLHELLHQLLQKGLVRVETQP